MIIVDRVLARQQRSKLRSNDTLLGMELPPNKRWAATNVIPLFSKWRWRRGKISRGWTKRWKWVSRQLLSTDGFFVVCSSQSTHWLLPRASLIVCLSSLANEQRSYDFLSCEISQCHQMLQWIKVIILRRYRRITKAEYKRNLLMEMH